MISKNDILNRWSKNSGKDYTHYDSVHKDFNSPNEIVPELIKHFSPKSVIDIGCGLGAWIKVFEKNGVKDYLGVEHIEFNKERLLISKDKVKLYDLGNQDTYPINIGRKFDIAMCLEVAEHLPEEISEKFVSFLSSLSDVILFSAAIPYQGGINHINEQWVEYWQERFDKCGFEFYDLLRDKIWNNENVQYWYKQNMFLVLKKGQFSFERKEILNYVHKDLYLQLINR